MKSRRHHQSAKRSRWAWNNSPDGLRNRRAKADTTRRHYRTKVQRLKPAR